MKPKLIIFDWDGTLADTTNPIIATFRQSFADCGLPVPEADRIRPLIGYSLPAIVRHLIPDADGRVQGGRRRDLRLALSESEQPQYETV